MPRRVLIVSPHFPPVNAPDCQRVRMLLPHLAEFGWEAHVLAVDPDRVEGFRDPDLVRTLPAGVPVTRAGAVPQRLTRRFGFGGLWLRAARAVRRAGDDLLAAGGFDLVYFTTTIFGAMTLGPRWQARFGVPYVLDIQDPWVNDYYHRTGVRPPGGWLRYALAHRRAKRQEPTAVRGAAHVVAVSQKYVDDFRSRYPDVLAERYTVLPFAAAEHDFVAAGGLNVHQRVFDPADGHRHWVYLGRGGRDMAVGLRGLFRGLKAARDDGVPGADKIRLHFVGTSYAADGRAERTVAPVAAECGLTDIVDERPARVPYLEGVALLKAAGVVLVVGSDDPGYSASKVYPCILAGRPVLAIMHEASGAGKVIRDCRAGELVTFAAGTPADELAGAVRGAVARVLQFPPGAAPPTDWEAFAPYTARAMTRRQCEVFDRACGFPAGPHQAEAVAR